MSPASERLARQLVAEGLGSALLLAAVVGSGTMAGSLARGNEALALLANSLATGAALFVLILTLAPISGAHFNPWVTLAEAARRRMSWRRGFAYIGAQVIGAFLGLLTAHAMFEHASLVLSSRVRSGRGQILSEVVATFGLVFTVRLAAGSRVAWSSAAIGAYIVSAYWFTGSTSFANAAVTIARAFTDTFTGIRCSDVPGFLLGQFLGAAAAVLVTEWLVPQPAAQGVSR